jgi:hypothetical protein
VKYQAVLTIPQSLESKRSKKSSYWKNRLNCIGKGQCISEPMGVLVPCSGQGHTRRGWCQVAAMKSTMQKFWNVISKYSMDGLQRAAIGSSVTCQEKSLQFLPYGRSIGSFMSYTQDVYMSHGTEYDTI